MGFPGSNILNAALRVISSSQFYYRAFLSRAVNDIGLDVAKYGNPQLLSGSAQPPARELFEMYGLDFQKNYMVFYVSKQMLDVTRDVSGDQIDFNGKTWQVLSKTDWRAIDGWISIITVQVENNAC